MDVAATGASGLIGRARYGVQFGEPDVCIVIGISLRVGEELHKAKRRSFSSSTRTWVRRRPLVWFQALIARTHSTA